MAKRVETDAGAFDADVLVVALGADLDPAATPGLARGAATSSTRCPAPSRAATCSHDFDGGRVIVAVTSTPFKCPPAPSETALLVHDFLVQRGLRERSEIALVMPMGVPIPPSPAASQGPARGLRGAGHHLAPGAGSCAGSTPPRKVARMADGGEMPYDLFLGVPVHRVPEVVAQSGMAVDGWIPVDPRTLETSYPDVYAVGDVTSVGTPKAGVFAEGQAIVVADAIIARARSGGDAPHYDGRGICYLEFGNDEVAKVDVIFAPGQPPAGDFLAPSVDFAADKREFGSTRIQRWFGRTWSTTG